MGTGVLRVSPLDSTNKDQSMTSGCREINYRHVSVISLQGVEGRDEGPDTLCLWLEFAKLAVCATWIWLICIFFVQYKVLKGDTVRRHYDWFLLCKVKICFY